MFSCFYEELGKKDLQVYDSRHDALKGLKQLYNIEMSNLKSIADKNLKALALEKMVYPALLISIDGKTYSDSMPRFDLFQDYYFEELNYLCDVVFPDSQIKFAVTKSKDPISLALIDEDLLANLTQEQMAFRKINILSIQEVEDQRFEKTNSINWFQPTRVDYSVNRLKHYTGVSAKYLQNYIVFVNYQKYLPYFLEFAKGQIANGQFSDLIGPGDFSLVENDFILPDVWNDSISLPQMPAYNLIADDGMGISLINIGVGPSNAKTMADHLSVLRPRFAMMLGHCGGLKKEHVIGDYILGTEHLMVNFDDIHCDSISYGFSCDFLKDYVVSKRNVHVGPVISVCDRNWELQNTKMHARFKDFGAHGIDMESAMMVKTFSQSHIPSTSFLCISDRPMHKEIRLEKMAKNFYANKLRNHLMDAVNMLQAVRKTDLRRPFKKGLPLFR